MINHMAYTNTTLYKMSNTYFNIRFGAYHLKWHHGKFHPSLSKNSYWVDNKPKPWFYIYQIGSYHFMHE